MKYNISPADAMQIFDESPTFRKYRFDDIAHAILQNHHMRDNKIAAIKMYRDIVGTMISQLPSLLDCKNVIERVAATFPTDEPPF